MYRLIKAVDRGIYVQIGDGENKKSLTGVSNLIDATQFLWDTAVEQFTLVNYVDKPDLSSKRISEVIAAGLNRRVRKSPISLPLILALAKPLDIIARISGIDVPITKARIQKYLTPTLFAADRIRELGFVPSQNTEDAVREMVRWYGESTRN
jgi:nucleoside-diphosphate-sugar epimerase